MSRHYDVIVAGGGPAGGSAAYHLVHEGARVLVIERQKLPRYKACGGAIPKTALCQFPFSFESVIETSPNQVAYAMGNYQIQLPLTRDAIVMVMRDRLDTYLLEKSGADVRTGAAVRSIIETNREVLVTTEDGEKLTARFLIGADGVNSTVARQTGLWRNYSRIPAIEVEVSVSESIFQKYARCPYFLFGAIRWGYAWIFPKADHLSVGIAALRPKRGELQTLLAHEMSCRGIDLRQGIRQGHTIPLFTRPRPVATNRTLLVGDAAGLVDPLTGEGIRFALKSGRLAATALATETPQRYTGILFRQIGLNHSFGIPLSTVFYLLPPLCFALGVSNPFATQAILDMLSDKAGYPQVIFRLFATLPVFAAAEVLARLLNNLGHTRKGDQLRSLVYRYDSGRNVNEAS